MASLLAAQIWKVFRKCQAKVVWVQNKLIVPAAHLHNIIDGEDYLVCGNGSKSFTWPHWERPWGKWMEGLFLYLIFIVRLQKRVCVCGGWWTRKLWFAPCCNIYDRDHWLAISESLYIKKVHCYGDPIIRVNVFGPGNATYMRGVTALLHLRHSAFIKAVERSTLKFIVIFRLWIN